MKKKIMSLEQLAEYCKQNNLIRFNSHEQNRSIVAQTFGQIEYEEDEQSDLIPVVCKCYHLGENRNLSSISKEAAKNCMKSIINKPILAEIIDVEVEHGVNANGDSYTKTIKDFGSHAMEYVEDENGEWKIKYIERPVGIIPESSRVKIHHDSDMQKDYVCATGYIFKHYGNETYDILKRRGGSTKCSVEIEIKDFEYRDGVLYINEYSVMGLTLLGDVMEGMAGSKVDLANFNSSYNQEFELTYRDQLEELNDKIDSLLSKFDIDTTRKEDNAMDNENIQVNENIEEVEFEDVENTEDVVETEATEEVEVETEEANANVELEEAEKVDTATDEETPEVVEEEVAETEDIETEEINTEEVEIESEEVNASENVEDVVVNEADNNELESLRSEFEEYKNSHSHTNEEFDALQEYHDNAEALKLHNQRTEILENDKFAMLKDCEEFKKLVKEMDNYSLVDLEREAKIIKADYVDVAVFASNKESEDMVFMSTSHSGEKKNKKQPYGGIFSDYKK